jgi:hypothetical protein
MGDGDPVDTTKNRAMITKLLQLLELCQLEKQPLLGLITAPHPQYLQPSQSLQCGQQLFAALQLHHVQILQAATAADKAAAFRGWKKVAAWRQHLNT